ncbi:sushi, von Willebrand factor type A, EGF and pentraxin domain-containing protein 1-like, partial [Saccostrea cucullata]|uniref:sushi, von Willebrand factor type A, EGF and pentraxin domain-containing protein 1-like n=1 Tax=Saccostrea cuccullata TaxID=36930 RepID=UPI002ED6B2A7
MTPPSPSPALQRDQLASLDWVQCPTPMPPLNGEILSNKQLFYYEDEINVECDHGYYPDPQRTTLKCGVEQGVGKWSTEMTNCTKGTCMTPGLTSDPNYNRIFPNESTRVDFGSLIIIECRYGTKYRNLSLYCGENGLSTYRLFGDTLRCPVIECGMPEQVPGADAYSYSDSLFGSSFNFSCQNGSTLSGKSVDGDYIVRCQENRQWGFGNLTCTVGRCTDPGTPGGAVQVVRSYEVGELLRFRCTRQGYEPVPSTPLLCVEQGSKNATWNSSDLPLCTDVTPPEFKNCPKTYYIDSMETVSFVTPTVTDNSGLVKNVTVDPSNFKSGTVVSRDLNVTYTAVDNGGNTARCTISFIIKGKPGSFVVADDKSELTGKKPLELCKEECLQDVQCKALFHTNGFCYIIKQDAFPELYTIDTSQLFYKIVTNCNMQGKPGSFVVAGDKSELTGKKSLDLCKEECLGDGQCKALYHTRGFCYIIRQDATPEPYTIDTASYFYKSCMSRYHSVACNSTLKNCSNQSQCVFQNHEAVCVCDE